jgi:hypothetical protein
MTLFANYNQVEDENLPIAAPSATSTASNLATFSGGSNTRDITVVVAGVRVAF